MGCLEATAITRAAEVDLFAVVGEVLDVTRYQEQKAAVMDLQLEW